MFHVNQFDTHKYEAVPYAKTVTEVRAPTDASITLYREMVEKARQEVVRTIAIGNENTLRFQGAVFSRGLSEDFVYTLTVNGIELTGTVRLRTIPKNDTVENIKNQLDSAIAEIALHVSRTIIKSWMPYIARKII